MTPLAARFYRVSAQADKDWLCQHQFFECTALADMASHMIMVDSAYMVMHQATELGKEWSLPFPFNETYFPPAQLAWIEWLGNKDVRLGLSVATTESGFTIEVVQTTKVGPLQMANIVYDRATDKFKLISIHDAIKQQSEGHSLFIQFGVYTNLAFHFCHLMNQPRLIDRVKRPTDKRILRDRPAPERIGSLVTWMECKIHPGTHYTPKDHGDGRLAERPLHYVRRFYKPTKGIWIDGYWRGNADIGVVLKTYSPQPPKRITLT